MQLSSRTTFGMTGIILGTTAGLGLFSILFVVFHLGGGSWQYANLLSAIVGGSLTLFAALRVPRAGEDVEPWLGRERLTWLFIGSALLLWGGGEGIWRYYSAIGQSPFPSLADLGYASLPPLIFIGLLLQPSSGVGSRRLLMLLDSLIAMGTMLTIGWYLLLGSLALFSQQNALARFLGLYYPTTDIALLSCVIFLLIRGRGSLYQATARRVSLIMLALGLCFFASSDFLFNVQQNAGIYVDGTWSDLGWPLGMLAMGVAAYLRCSLPLTSEDMIEQRLNSRDHYFSLGYAQVTIYGMLGILLIMLVLNVFSTAPAQLAIRPVLVLATVLVIGLVVVRQILTLHDNERLTRRQANSLERLEAANLRIEEQVHMIAERNTELEQGIQHLKAVQAQLASGNLQARARLTSGELLSLSASLNLMAERLLYLEQAGSYAQRLTRALQELTVAVECHRNGEPLRLPASCRAVPELNRLLYLIGLRANVEGIPGGSMPGASPPGAVNPMGAVNHAPTRVQASPTRQPPPLRAATE